MHSPRFKLLLVTLMLLLTAAATGFSFLSAPSADAATCTHGATRWLYNGCCQTHTYYKLEWCRNGTWVDTGTRDCRGVCQF